LSSSPIIKLSKTRHPLDLIDIPWAFVRSSITTMGTLTQDGHHQVVEGALPV